MARPSGQIKHRAQKNLGLAAAKDLYDVSPNIRHEEPMADERTFVQTGSEFGQHAAIAVSRIDPQHVAAVHLGRDDEASWIELDGVGHAAVEADPPDLIRSHHREVQLAIRPYPPWRRASAHCRESFVARRH